MNDYERLKRANEIRRRCKNCEYAKRVYAQNDFKFTGCYFAPYHGKWISEIQACPKNET